MLNGLIAVGCVATIAWISWEYRRQITNLFDFFRQAKNSLIFLAVAWILFGAPQIRELLWIRYGGTITDLDPNHSNYLAFARLFYYETLFSFSTLSLLLVAFCLIALNPDYRASLWQKPTAASDAGRVSELLGYGLITSGVFLAIVVYNIIAATFPFFPSNKLFAYIAINIVALIVPLNVAASAVDVFARDAKAMPPTRQPPRAGRASQIMGLAVGLLYALPMLGAHLLLVGFILAALGIFVLSVPLKYLGFDFSNYLNDSIVIVNLFLAALLALLALIRWTGHPAPKEPEASPSSGGDRRWPLLGMLVLFALGLSLVDLNDNHRIRELNQSAAHVPPSTYDIGQAFKDWIAARPDRAEFQTYPVYVIAAEGGGIYAAYHAALFLAAVQDRFPSFADHIFAISAVSGGSLGASVFSSLVGKNRTREGNGGTVGVFEEETKAILSQDFLSRLVFATLFYDLPAHLVPCFDWFCPGRPLDRAIALETSFESAWRSAFRDGATKNPFEQSISANWSAKGNAPALLLNTTEVETGERVVAAPFSLKSVGAPDLRALIDRAPDLDVRLSTAVGLSARFPGLTPAAWYIHDLGALPPLPPPTVSDLLDRDGVEKDRQKAARRERLSGPVRRRLVDGGYFDNSGVATALDVISALRNIAGTAPDGQPAKFILIALTSRQEEGAADLGARGFGELLSPLRTLESVRSTRASSLVRQAHVALDGHACAGAGSAQPGPATSDFDWCVRVATLDTGDVRLPLGWMLSDRSRQAIENSISDCTLERPRNCLIFRQIGLELKQTAQ